MGLAKTYNMDRSFSKRSTVAYYKWWNKYPVFFIRKGCSPRWLDLHIPIYAKVRYFLLLTKNTLE